MTSRITAESVRAAAFAGFTESLKSGPALTDAADVIAAAVLRHLAEAVQPVSPARLEEVADELLPAVKPWLRPEGAGG
jgi:hypothetical protein